MLLGSRANRRKGESGIAHQSGTQGDVATGTEMRAPAIHAGDQRTPATDLRGAALRLFALSLDLMATAGFDGYIKHANPAWEDVLGWTLEELQAQPYLDLVHPEDRERTRAEAAALAAVEGVETRDFEVRFQTKDGTYRWLLFSAQAGAEEGVIYAVAKDITDRRDADSSLEHTTSQLRRRAAELERSNADLEQFAYVASHDLSEPLRQVSGFVQLLAKRYAGKLDDDADQFISFAVDGVNRMQGLIDDLLTFSRIGRDGHEAVDVDLGAVAREALGALSAQVAESGATVTIGALPTLPGNPRELSQLMQNLMSNAIKFRGAATPHAEVSAQRDDADPARPGAWEIAVADNGIGVEPRHVDRIFKMFQRLHSREAYPGNGIGLAVCKKIVERHDGRIWVEPNAGGGSVFKFTLPAPDGAKP
jgi:PAS domain S-box-containing protein